MNGLNLMIFLLDLLVTLLVSEKRQVQQEEIVGEFSESINSKKLNNSV
jgi:hypothetical protein